VSLSIGEDRRPDGPGQPPPSAQAAPPAAKPFWRRPWIIPLWAVTAAFLWLQTGPFVGTPEAEAPIPPHEGFAAYYPLLITHISLGTVAMIACCLQVWPWIRQRHPKVHRISGRIYVPVTVVSGVCAIIIIPFAPPVGQIGGFMSTTLWIITTLVGFWAVRRRKFALHRRFMLYSFALVMNNVWGLTMSKIIFGFGIQIDFVYLGEAARWVGWTVNLMLVQWFLYRTMRRPVEGPVRQAAGA
jgi:uncharacterized membrane protein YozB (DUF420 family)